MAWVKLDDHFDQHPKLQSVGPLGLALWVSGIAYCNRNLTDGRIPWSVARSLIATKHLDPQPESGKRRVWSPSLACGMGGMDGDEMVDEIIRMLIRAGLWDETDSGYQVHDYLGFQPSKQQVLAERERDRNRKRKPDSMPNPNGIHAESAAPDPVPVPVPTPETRTRDSEATGDADASPPSRAARKASPNGHANGKTDDWTESFFEHFWPSYPRKVSKPHALKAWRSIKPHTQEHFNAVMDGLDRWCDWWKSNPDRQVCHAATWLNGERWNDEP